MEIKEVTRKFNKNTKYNFLRKILEMVFMNSIIKPKKY